MKRMSMAFYKDIDDLRSAYGETEYDRNQILPAVVGLLRKHAVNDADLMRDAANSILDNLEKAEDAGSQGGLFPYEAQVALGERHRIKRGRLNAEQLWRRKRIIDHNKRSQDMAWGKESGWIEDAMDALKGHDPSTTVRDVIPEIVITKSDDARPRPRA